MANEAEIKGKKALNRVKQKIGGNIANLRLLIQKKSPGGSISSCALTSAVLSDVIDPALLFNSTPTVAHLTVGAAAKKVKSNNNSWDALGGLGGKGTGLAEGTPLRQEDRVREIVRLLEKPVVVFITTVPDHHFTVFPFNKDDLVILQGFQGVYNLVDWMQSTFDGKIVKTAFIAALTMLVSGNAAEREAGAVTLFSYDRLTRGEVASFYREAAEISTFSHKKL
jgi:hypothetical protein